MRFYSDVTKKFYDSTSECLKAEKEFEEVEKRRLAEEQKKKDLREARMKEIEELHEANMENQKRENELMKAYIHDYGDPESNAFVTHLSDFLSDLIDTLLDD